jgi:hypothetical protein
MSGLGEQIAVLDGLSVLDPNDGRIGQQRARVNQYARRVMRDVLAKRRMISAANGANYSGGSNYFPGSPLMPSSVGLADFPSTLPQRYNVISPSGGVNYGGGSSYARGLPLLPSSAGLANTLIDGGYGRAGLGASLINGGYGRAGLGGTGSAVDEDLAAAAESIAVARRLDPRDGRLGQQRARVDQYGRQVRPGVLDRTNVIDPSEGANYGGGSNYFPRGPVMPSAVGLADASFYRSANVISPSGGANYGGGSDYYPGSPLLTSNVGLTGCGCGMSGFGATATQTPAGQTVPVAWTPAALTRRAQILVTLRNRFALWKGRTNLTQEQALRVDYLRLIIQSHAMSLIAHNPRNAPAMRLQAKARQRKWDAGVCGLRQQLRMPPTPVCARIARERNLLGQDWLGVPRRPEQQNQPEYLFR